MGIPQISCRAENKYDSGGVAEPGGAQEMDAVDRRLRTVFLAWILANC